MEDTIETIIFTAKEPSRARMYDTLSKRVAAKFGWHVVPYDEMQKRYIDYLDALDFNFVIAKGPAPEQYKDANKPQHGEFKPILYVYHTEDPNLPSIKLHAKSDEEAYQWVVNNLSKIQGYQDQEIDTKKLRATTIKPGLRKILDLTKLTENFANNNPQATNQESGPEWESKLMDIWSPKASKYMARVVKQSFNSLYPDVKLKVWAEDEGVTATTDLASTDVKADVFGQWGKKDWECNFFCGPLFNHADGRKYLELMVDDAASGSYPGVWKIIVSEWKKYALSQLKKTGADDVCFSVNEDMSGGAWEKIAGAVGIKYIAHDLDEGNRRQVENFADGKNPQDKGDSRRHGVPTKASVGTLRKVAKQGGRKGQLAHWMANMKAGKAKKK
jgi:hypothetical protein